MSAHKISAISRRAFLAAGARLGAALAAPSVLHAATRPSHRARRVLDGRALGLVPDARADQTLPLAHALRQAARENAWIRLPPGTLRIGALDVRVPVRLIGHKGSRLLLRKGAGRLLSARGVPVELEAVILDGNGEGGPDDALVEIVEASRLHLDGCRIEHFDGTALHLAGCRGRIADCLIRDMGNAALFAQDSHGLRITGNTVRNCANNGVLVWQSAKRPDGALIADNDIRQIGARLGGDGPNGNGINIYRAGNVTIRHNRIRACAFSAIRNNSGDDCRILDNDCRDIKEVAIFVEFAWRHALVRGNRVRTAGAGISATNMDHGGRGAMIENNTVEDVRPRIRSVDIHGYGIAAEADTVIRRNVVRKASHCGLSLGWGPYLDNVKAVRNRLEDCGHGIIVSVSEGAGRVVIVENEIVRPRRRAIAGFDHAEPVTGELLGAREVPSHVSLRGNRVRR